MLEGDMPRIVWLHSCLKPACGAVFEASVQEPLCRECGGVKLKKLLIIRKVSGECVPKSDTENPFVEQFDLDDD